MALDFLSLYGPNFQTRVIALLMTDKDFLSQVYSSITPDFFESDANKELVGIIMDHFKEYNTTPGFQVFSVKVAELHDSIAKTSIVEQLRAAKQYIENPEDMKFIKDEFKKFCKNQKLKSAIIDSVELLKAGKYDEIKSKIDEAMTVGMDNDIGTEYTIDSIDARYSKPARQKIISTGWVPIDEITQGGLGEGDLGVVVGVQGTGKSWSLVSLGLHALTLGKNVLHFTMELNEEYTLRRYESRLIGFTAQNLPYNVEEIKMKWPALIKGRLVTQFYPTKYASVLTLKSAVNKAMAYGFNPDIILVDSADNLCSDSSDKNQNSYNEMGTIYEDLRGMAGEYQLPMWTVSQANRSAEEEEVIKGGKISESYKKGFIADFIMSLSRREEDKLAGSARWYIIKNRYGADALTFPSKMDASIGRIEIYAPTSVKGTEARKDMRNSNELLRKELANRYSDLTNFE